MLQVITESSTMITSFTCPLESWKVDLQQSIYAKYLKINTTNVFPQYINTTCYDNVIKELRGKD